MGAHLRIFSANVWNGRAHPGRLAELVGRVEADVACFQELAPEQAEAVSEVLPHGRLEPARDHNGMGIALRRPGSHGRLALPRRDARMAVLDPADWPELPCTLEVVNAHIQGFHVFPWWRSMGIRAGQAQGLLRYLADAPPRPRALVGDFNAVPGVGLHRRLTRHLEDAARIAARRRRVRPAPTWRWGPGWPRLLRIDHALVDGVGIQGVQVLEVPGGDHSAVVLDLELA